MKIKKLKNVDLKNYSSFHIGGKAKNMFFPKNISQIRRLILRLESKGEKYHIIGNGTNILFADEIYENIVCLRDFLYIFLENNQIVCSSGVNLFSLCKFCEKNGLSGIEFLYGIPGTVGGAVAGNAGAFGGEICNFIPSITVLKNGEIIEKNGLSFSYRRGPLESGEILLEAKIKLNKAKNSEIIAKNKQFFEQRKISQPYQQFLAGSVFKRCGEIIPSKLIDEWGLKGIRVGGASVSESAYL